MRIQDMDNIETGLHASQRRSEWRRSTARRRRTRRKRLRRLFALPAIVGLVVCVHQVTLETLTPRDQVILLLGALLVIPFLSTWDGEL